MTSPEKTPVTTPATYRPVLSPLTLKLVVALFLLATANGTFWDRFPPLVLHDPKTLVLGGVIAFGVVLFSISLLALPWLVRPGLALAVILAAVAAYFQDRLGVVIDRDMILNAVTTTSNEARHLFTLDYITHLALFGLVPAAVILWVRIRPLVWWRHLLHYAVGIALGFGLFAAATISDYKTFSALMREHREITTAIIPATPVNGAIKFVRQSFATRNIVAEPIGLDAQKGNRIAAAGKPVLTLIVVGETARAANWSLGSYERPTNPELAKRDIIYIDKVRSCGTSTAVSLPCMFAHYGAENHSKSAAMAHENLLDVLNRSGFDVSWFDNNTGHLGIAKRVNSMMFKAADSAEACGRGECTDLVFLPKLDELLATITKDTVIVYHQIGSHGPAYYLRYPETQAPFQPACQTSDFGKCTAEEIVNAYDNTIAYTDWFLAQAIDKLAAQDRVITSMFYVSDHGESLGEDGMYLHAAPYFMAPDVQTQVPMVIWASPAYKAAFGLDTGCVKARAAVGEVSHDAVFHTLLGLTDVQTSLHKPELDLTEGCRG